MRSRDPSRDARPVAFRANDKRLNKRPLTTFAYRARLYTTLLYTTVHDVMLSIGASSISLNDRGAAARSQEAARPDAVRSALLAAVGVMHWDALVGVTC